MTARSFLLDVAGGRRRIRVLEAGDGASLVFLHGAGGLVEESPFLAMLARRWHVFAPLLPGYGDSEGGETLPDMLAITLHSFDVIEALDLSRPTLVGHSMGGMIAAEMAAVNPYGLRSLVLVCAAGLWLDEHPVPDIFSMLPFELAQVLFAEKVMPRLKDIWSEYDGSKWWCQPLDDRRVNDEASFRDARRSPEFPADYAAKGPEGAI